MLERAGFDLKEFWQLQAIHWSLNILKAMVILGVGWFAAQLAMRFLSDFLRRIRMDPTLVSFLSSLIYALLLIIVAVTVLSELGVHTASLVAVLGAAGLALGLSLQSALSNLASGIMLLTFRSFRAGDTIEVAGMRGQVTEILIFQTILTTDDGQRVLIPNSKLTSEVVRHKPATSSNDPRQLP